MVSREKTNHFYSIFRKNMKRLFCYIIFFINLSISNAQEVQLSLPIKHSSYINHFIFSSDRRYVYTSSNDMSIKLWYFSSGNILKTFIGHTCEIKDIAVNKGNTLLFSADKEGNIFVWNVLSGNIQQKIKLGASIECINWYDSKNELAVSTIDGKITWYNLPDFSVKKSISTAPYIAIKIIKAKEPDMYYFGFKKLSNCTNSVLQRGNVQMFDLSSNTFFPLCTYTDDLNNLILSPDSSKLISASSENFMVRVWDTGKLIEETTIKNPAKPYALFVSRTNKMIGVGSGENGELHVYRNSGEEILSTVIDTGYIVYGEINNDITRIHLLNNFGQFKKYDFDFNLKEVMGIYASIHDDLFAVSYSTDNKTVVMGLKNGKTKLFDLLKMQTCYIPDSFNTFVKQIFLSKGKIALFYEPYFTFNENNGTTTSQSKFFLYDLEQKSVVQSLIFNDKYITSIFLESNLLFLGFNNGKIEIWDVQINKKLDAFQVSPYDILKIYYNSNSKRLFIKSIDNQVYVYLYKALGKLELQKNIYLNDNDDILSFNADNFSSKTKVAFNSKEYTHATELSSFLNGNQCILKSKDSIFSINNNDSILWSKPNNFFNTQFILNDSILKKTLLIDFQGNICILDSRNGNQLCNLYFDKNTSWICTSKEFYDIDERLINRVYAVKGITFVESDLKKQNRKQGLLQKILQDVSE